MRLTLLTEKQKAKQGLPVRRAFAISRSGRLYVRADAFEPKYWLRYLLPPKS